uniref:Uncharacterized protein n=1 Tax=Arundo donax TaxID=35708 RepID=A0A0A9EKZ8_ARUDO
MICSRSPSASRRSPLVRPLLLLFRRLSSPTLAIVYVVRVGLYGK